MPRIPRKNFQTNFYHVMVQGINKEFILKIQIISKNILILFPSI